MNKEIRKALISMGYRRFDYAKERWGKPLGWQLLTFEEDRRELTLWFQSQHGGKLMRWDAKEIFIDYEDEPAPTDFEGALKELKTGEAYVLTEAYPWRGNYWDTHFHFLTVEEEARSFVDDL